MDILQGLELEFRLKTRKNSSASASGQVGKWASENGERRNNEYRTLNNLNVRLKSMELQQRKLNGERQCQTLHQLPLQSYLAFTFSLFP